MCLPVPFNKHSIKTNRVFKGRFLQELSGLTEGLHDLISIIAGMVTQRSFLTRELRACTRASCRYDVENGTRSLDLSILVNFFRF